MTLNQNVVLCCPKPQQRGALGAPPASVPASPFRRMESQVHNSQAFKSCCLERPTGPCACAAPDPREASPPDSRPPFLSIRPLRAFPPGGRALW